MGLLLSAQKCHFKKIVDKNDGAKTIRTARKLKVVFENIYGIHLQYNKTETEYYLNFLIGVWMGKRMNIEENDTLTLTLIDNSEVVLLPRKISIGKLPFKFKATEAMTEPEYSITVSQLEELSKNRIIHIRINYTYRDGTKDRFDFDVSEKYGQKILNASICILSQ